tara:strand:- start:1033 stop:1713 length:681 start_codon:yes stop_codon:yes gene_type:complete
MVEVADLSGFNWDELSKYADEIIDELTDGFTVAFIAEYPNVPLPAVQRIGAEWARVEGGELITRVNGSTKGRVGDIVADAIEKGESLTTISKRIQDDYIFDRRRAELVARTERAKAMGVGQRDAAVALGRNEKRWITQGDERVRESHRMNSQMNPDNGNWIAIGDQFTSGAQIIEDINCRCIVRYRTQELFKSVEFRCPGCSRLLGKDVYQGTRILCRHCKEERVA